MITTPQISQKSKPHIWHWFACISLVFLLFTLHLKSNADWHLDIGASSTRSFGSHSTDAEFTHFLAAPYGFAKSQWE
jgi:hypothetical protein